jgi:hypothetical protein
VKDEAAPAAARSGDKPGAPVSLGSPPPAPRPRGHSLLSYDMAHHHHSHRAAAPPPAPVPAPGVGPGAADLSLLTLLWIYRSVTRLSRRAAAALRGSLPLSLSELAALRIELAAAAPGLASRLGDRLAALEAEARDWAERARGALAARGDARLSVAEAADLLAAAGEERGRGAADRA